MNKMLELGLKYYGLKEISGTENNPRIVQMFHEAGFDYIDDDETAWCSAFINWLALQTGYEHSSSLLARSWLEFGEIVPVPDLGDIAIFSRGDKNSYFGHIGLYITERDGYIYVLGGNQNNEVNISKYSKMRLLGFRKLRET